MNSFSILIGLGASIGLAWVAWRSERVEGESIRTVRNRLNAGLIALAGALVGGRISFVIINWPYFQINFAEVAEVWLGGLTWAGALAGCLVSVGLFAWLNDLSLGRRADGLLPLARTVTLTAWLVCWQAGCAYGPVVTNRSWGVPARDEAGQVAARLPLQLAGAMLTLGTFWLVDFLRPHLRRRGQAASLAFLGISAQLLTLSFLRADPVPLWNGLRLDSWAGLVYSFIAVLVCLGVFLPRTRQIPSTSNI